MLQISTTNKILDVFFKEPTKKHYLKEISRKINIAHTSVNVILNELLKENLIIKEIEIKGSRIFPIYTANFQEKEHKALKRIHNIKSMQDSGLLDFLINETTPKSITLFGSYAKGEDIEESDIDIFIEAEPKKLNLKKFEDKLKKKIEIQYNPKLKTYSKELKNNIANGIVLFGFIEVY